MGLTNGNIGGLPDIVGHIAENRMIIYDEFREGNIPPAADNYQFIIKMHISIT